MKKNKNGSTLITTVIILMFITTVSIGMLSVVSTNYYGRVSESKRTQNLYGSESGLDTTYNIIEKTVTAANYYGNQKVVNLKQKVDDIKNREEYKTQIEKLNSLDTEEQKVLYALYTDIDYWKYYNGIPRKNNWPKPQEEIDRNIAADNEAIYRLTNKVFKDGFKNFIRNYLNTSISGKLYKSATVDPSTKAVVIDPDTKEVIYTTKEFRLDDSKVYLGHYLGREPGAGEKNAMSSLVNDMLTPKVPQGAIPIEALFNDKNILKVENQYNQDGQLIYDEYPIDGFHVNLYDEENYQIAVTSEFKTNSTNTSKVGENLKVIEANYSIRVPNYEEVSFKKSVSEVDPKLNQKISNIAIGGDFEVQGVNKLNVNGDIFVQGNSAPDTDDNTDVNIRISNKYSGGIKLDNLNNNVSTQKTVNFNNNVYTRGTFNVRNIINGNILSNSSVENKLDILVNGDLYAKNIYAEDKNDGNESNPTTYSNLLVSKDVVLDNDLTLKAANTRLKLNNFYGINDKNVTDTISSKIRKSSSIIINDYTKDPPKNIGESPYGVAIDGEAYIMGVAHINTKKGYQTGESIATKGNYKAYSVPDPEASDTENFEYDDPLQLLQADTVEKKTTHFYNYWFSNKPLLDCGGVYLNPDKIHSIGAIVYNSADKLRGGNWTASDESNIIVPKRRSYSENVYTISKNEEYASDDIKNSELDKLYAGITNSETVQGILAKNTNNDGVWSGSKDNTGEGYSIFCADSSKRIVIKGENFTNKDLDGNVIIKANDMVIDATDKKNVNAVIVTNGDVVIDGDVNFRGNIIAAGNLSILGSSTVNLSYDESVIQNIQSRNKEIFNDVFGNVLEEPEEGVLNIESNATNFIKNKLWKIIQ